MLQKLVSILGAVAIVTGTTLLFGGPVALAASGAQRDGDVRRAPDSSQRHSYKRYGPYDSHREAKDKARSLERQGFHTLIEEHHDQYYVVAWKTDNGPDPSFKEKTYGPYASYHEAKDKARSLERQGYHTRIKEERRGRYFVVAWMPHR